VTASRDAFAAIEEDGSVVTWGDPESGGDSSSVQEYISSGVAAVYGIQGIGYDHVACGPRVRSAAQAR